MNITNKMSVRAASAAARGSSDSESLRAIVLSSRLLSLAVGVRGEWIHRSRWVAQQLLSAAARWQ